MELCSKNDSMVFKVYKKLYNKKNDAYSKNMHQILDLALPAYDELFDEIDT